MSIASSWYAINWEGSREETTAPGTARAILCRRPVGGVDFVRARSIPVGTGGWVRSNCLGCIRAEPGRANSAHPAVYRCSASTIFRARGWPARTVALTHPHPGDSVSGTDHVRHFRRIDGCSAVTGNSHSRGAGGAAGDAGGGPVPARAGRSPANTRAVLFPGIARPPGLRAGHHAGNEDGLARHLRGAQAVEPALDAAIGNGHDAGRNWPCPDLSIRPVILQPYMSFCLHLGRRQNDMYGCSTNRQIKVGINQRGAQCPELTGSPRR
jgi:hypothetical protein